MDIIPEGKRFWAAALFLSVTSLLALVWVTACRPAPQREKAGQTGRILEQFAAPGQAYADPAQCLECHREAYEAWRGSHHHLANAALRPEDVERLLHRQEGLPRERGMRWRRVGETIVLEERDGSTYPVVGSIGIHPLIQYLHLMEDGRIQAHDVAWDVEREEWFSVFEREDVEPRVSGEWGHWTGQGMNWDANCAFCHMTEYHKAFDPVTNTYDRNWTHMSITCAQCHPGMEVHMDQIRNGNTAFKEDLSKVQVMDYCATCHSRREELTPEAFVAGDRYEDHYRLTLADVEGIYHPDGQVIGENYVYGSLMMSKMGHAGVTCMDCHDPHTAGHILPFENNALCQRCHGSGLMDAPRIDPLAHSHHPAESTGNLCVECHMPVTHFMGRDGRRDHSFSHPDPQLTIEMGIPNACTNCHNTQSDEWALRYTDEWYGPDMNADRRAKARLLNDLFADTSGTGARLVAALQTEKNRFWKATFTSMLRYLPPDAATGDLLRELVEDPEPMVRSAAVRTIGLDSLDPAVQEGLLTDEFRMVRLSATLASPDLQVAGPEDEAELEAYLRHTADSPVGALRYGAYLHSRGQTEAAEQQVRQSVAFEESNPEAWRLAGIELHRMGHSGAAMQFLRNALGIDPGNAQVLFNMGLLAYETGETDTALRRLSEAVLAEPRFEDAWYNLIVLYWSLNDTQTARSKLREALTHLPQSQRLRQLAQQLQSQP